MDVSRRRPSLWVGYLLAAVAVSAVCCATSGALRSALVALVSCSSAVAIAVGILVHRPLRPSAWWCMAAGMGAWSLGDISYCVVYDVLGAQAYPGLPDLFYLLAYPLLVVALLGLARQAHPGRDVEGVVDATILAVGAGLLSYAFLLRPALAMLRDDVLGGAVSAAYPVADVFVLAALVRLMTATGSRSASFRLLASAAAVMLLADAAYQISYAAVGYDGSALDPCWLVGYFLWGASALHPSMRRLSDPSPSPGRDLDARRLLLLAGASLLAPGTLALELLLERPLSAWAVVLTSTVLFLLVLTRMWTLLRRVRAQARELDGLARTDPLTGLPNRRSGDAELARHLDLARRGEPLVVALLDLDRFKRFNDTFGHPAGDRLLVDSADAWRGVLEGTGACLARWGGEEFLLCATGLAPQRVEALLAQLRAVVPEGQSFSAGTACWNGEEAPTALLARADAALYRAKEAGRACTRSAEALAGSTA